MNKKDAQEMATLLTKLKPLHKLLAKTYMEALIDAELAKKHTEPKGT